jgi:hypothetical protein
VLVGALLGIATVVDGFSGFAVTALFAVVGLVVGKVVQGDIDVSRYVSSTEQKIRGRT